MLGSGLGAVADAVGKAVAEYTRSPRFPARPSKAILGRRCWGRVGGVPVAVFQGRAHLYEGGDPEAVRVPCGALRGRRVGAVLTNAAAARGRPGLRRPLRSHQHAGHEPAGRANDETIGPRFPSLRDAYDPNAAGFASRIGGRARHPARRGRLPGRGPNLGVRPGADAVGMSTVQETIIASDCGLRVAAVSVITNLAEGMTDEPLGHEQTLRAARRGGSPACSSTSSRQLIPRKRDGYACRLMVELVRGIARARSQMPRSARWRWRSSGEG